MFKKYPSIENSYRKKFIDGFVTAYPELLTARYVLTEKIHGANFQVYFEPNKPWQYGRRTSFLEEGEKFYNVWNVVNEYEMYFDRLQKLVDYENTSIRLYGEFYGPGIGKGVVYSDQKRIRFFDVVVDDILLPPQDFHRIFQDEFEEFTAPVVAFVGGLQKALEYDIEFNSLLNPIADNVCEGVVIAPLRRVYYHRQKRFCLKKKNEKFMEKVKAPKPAHPADPAVTHLNLEFRSYITNNRLQSIFSQYGEIEEPSQIGPYIKLVLIDAKEAFLKDFGGEIAALPKGDARKVFNVGSMIALMLKKAL